MKNGKTIYENRLKEFNENHEDDDPYIHDGRHELARVLTRENRSLETYYSPMKLENFSPYEEDHKYRTLYEADREFIDGVEVTESINRMTLPKAEQLFQYQFDRCLEEHDNDIHIFLCHTALGKTETIKEAGSNTLLAFPTHQLKEEVMDRRDDYTTAISTPQLPVFESDGLNQELSRLYELGFRGAAYKKIVEVAHQITSDSYIRHDRNKAAKYLKKQKEIRVTNKTVMTTHDWAIHSGGSLEQVDQIVYDECPMESLAAVESIKISDLVKMANKVGEGMFRDDDTKLLDLVSYLMGEVEEGEITELPDRFELDLKEDINVFSQMVGLSSNVVQFFESDYLYREEGDPDTIHFINTKYFPADKKIIVLSASANVPFYEEMYGKNRVNVYDISEIHQKGEVHQHLNKSFSRTSLKASLEEANKLTKDKPTITFMTMKDKIKTSVDDVYFGNCSGYDHYSNTSLNILGTNHKSNSLYYLLGAVLGIPVKHPKDREFGRKSVEFNGLRFTFSTFLHNERLSQLQLAIIHGESVQAVGRARTLRYDCRVDLYSNLPLRQAAPNYHF